MAKEAPKEGGAWPMDWEWEKPFGMAVLSMVVIIVWLLFILFYALFWSSGFTFFQNIVVTIVSLVITGMLLGLAWMFWGWRHAKWRGARQGGA